MNPSNKTFVLALGSLLGLALAACSGGAASGDDAVAAPSGSASGSANATPPSPPGSPAPQPPAASPLPPSSPDAGTVVKTNPSVVEALHRQPRRARRLHRERPGSRGGHRRRRHRPPRQPDLRRRVGGQRPGRVRPDEVPGRERGRADRLPNASHRARRQRYDQSRVERLRRGSLAGCAANVPLGKVDTVKVKIAPGTPPGEYDLTWNDAGFIGNASAPPQCTTIGHGIGGKLRVLP